MINQLRIAAKNIICWQIVLLLSGYGIASLMQYQANVGLSLIIGQLVSFLTFWLFFLCFFTGFQNQNKSAEAIWRALIFSEFTKIILTVGLFVLALRWSELFIPSFLLGFVTMQITQIILQAKYLTMSNKKIEVQ